MLLSICFSDGGELTIVSIRSLIKKFGSSTKWCCAGGTVNSCQSKLGKSCWLDLRSRSLAWFIILNISRREIIRLFYWIGHANSCVNPFLYVPRSRSYRRRMLQILQRLGFFCNFCGFHRSKIHSLTSENEPALFASEPCRLDAFTARSERVCARS